MENEGQGIFIFFRVSMEVFFEELTFKLRFQDKKELIFRRIEGENVFVKINEDFKIRKVFSMFKELKEKIILDGVKGGRMRKV